MMPSAEERCVECGTPLPANMPKGLCSRCALKGALRLSDFEDDGELVYAESPTPFLSPKPFGDYELLEEVARGGMGIVYKARQKSLDRIVAIKMLLFGPMASQAVIRRFRVEAVAAGGLDHPNIVAIHEVGIHDGQHFLVMDYVDGPNLATFAHHQPLPPRSSAEIMRTIAEAIDYAHGCGILHRDIKPSNILIGKSEVPRVTDFGLARRMEGDSSLTVSGHPLGSPSYMPPEQASSRQGKVSARSDVYGLGATLYHLLTGHPPFQGDSVAHTLDQVLHQEPVSPRLLNPRIPQDLETICLKCLQKDPNQRLATAGEVAAELDRFLKGEPIHSRPVSAVEKLWRYCKRKPALAGLIATVAMLVLLVAIGSPITVWRIRKAQQRLSENLYAADMKLVQLSLNEGNWGRARSLLDSYIPALGERDLRGFEWGYFARLSKGDQLRTVAAHSNIISSISFVPNKQTIVFAPNSQMVATASFDGSVKFWDYPSLRLLSQISIPGQPLLSLSFRDDGQLLATTTANLGAYIWQVNSNQLLTKIPGEWSDAAFAPFGTNLALSGGRVWGEGEGSLSIWDSTRQQVVRSWEKSGSRVAWSPDAKTLFSGPVQGGIAAYELASTSQSRILDAEPRLLSLACSPDGRLLAAATVGVQQAAPHLRLWERGSGRLIAELHGHTANIWKVLFSPDNRLLASGSSDQSVRLWDSATGRLLSVLRGHGDEVWSLAFTPDGKLLSVDKQGTMLLWDLPKPAEQDLNSQIETIVGPRIFSPDSRTMAVGIGRQRVALVDLESEQPRHIIENADLAVDFEENGRALLILASNGLSRVQLEDNQITAPRQLDPPLRNFQVLALSRDHRLLASENEPGQLCVWDLKEARLIQKAILPPGRRITNLKFSPDASQLAFVRERVNDVLVYSEGLKRLTTLKKHSLEAWSMDFSQDGALFATAAMDDRIFLWRNHTFELVTTLEGHKEGVSGVAFSPDGKTLAALCGNRSVKLWNIATRREVANLSFNHMSAYPEFSPDGQTLVACKPWLPEARFEFWHAQGRMPLKK